MDTISSATIIGRFIRLWVWRIARRVRSARRPVTPTGKISNSKLQGAYKLSRARTNCAFLVLPLSCSPVIGQRHRQGRAPTEKLKTVVGHQPMTRRSPLSLAKLKRFLSFCHRRLDALNFQHGVRGEISPCFFVTSSDQRVNTFSTWLSGA